VVARGEIARVVYIEASIDCQALTTYKADGVIVATATGSTGYALAAGGPVLYPQSRDFVMVPVVPHLSLGYPLVLPPGAIIRLKLTTVYPATLSIDGHINLPLSTGDTVTIRRSPNTIRFLRIRPEAEYYASLEARLKGK
jgi:NAD+ kinase